MFSGQPGEHVVLVNWRDVLRPPSGGAQVYCTQVARELAARGLRVTVLTSAATGSAGTDPEDDGVHVVRFGEGTRRYASLLAWLARHRAHVDAVVDCQNGIPSFSPLVLPRRLPVALLVLHLHQKQYDAELRWPLDVLGQWLEGGGTRAVYGRRPVCAVSPSSRGEVRRKLQLRGRSFVAPFGQAPEPPVARERARHPQIVCVGRLLPHKRWHLLLQAMHHVRTTHPDAQLHLVGEGPERPALQGHIDRLGLGDVVLLRGPLDDAERDDLLASAWLTASASEGEGWGLTLMEAAALGVPSVALDTPGLRDAVRPGRTGWLATEPEHLPEALVGALSTLADDRVAQAYGARCRAWARTFSWSATAERLLAVLTAEARRLAMTGREQRERNDVATVVHIPLAVAAAPAVGGALRSTDQLMETPDGDYRLLLAGADEHDTSAALARLGIQDLHGEVRIGLARPHDLIGWPSGDREASA